jgi:predicted CDP-diglyceride synthetase/phosphatidate cytidylyltransferase
VQKAKELGLVCRKEISQKLYINMDQSYQSWYGIVLVVAVVVAESAWCLLWDS